MKLIVVLICLGLLACNNSNTENSKKKDQTDSANTTIEPPKKNEGDKKSTSDYLTDKYYSNARFKDVIVKKTGENEYTIEGKGQIFEANFNYVVEDGHEELKKGYQMTDAGAPEWGKFKFTLDVPKKRPNSSLTLIIFEISANDGSRQHELPIPLPDK